MPHPRSVLTAALKSWAGDPGDDTADTIQGLIGANNANNAQGTSSVVGNANGSVLERLEYQQTLLAGLGDGSGTPMDTNKSIVDALGSNGTAVTYGAGSITGAIGTRHVIQKTLAATAIATTGVDLTGASSGVLVVENIIVETDGEALADATALEVYTDNAAGNPLVLSQSVAALTGNSTCDVSTADTYGRRTALETGKKLSARATGTAMTGTGNITVTMQFLRVSAGATVEAA